MARETITLGGGCFWCTEAVFEQVDGVLSVESGYSNGHTRNPSYQQVCGGDTGHNEVVRVEFDNQRISRVRVARGDAWREAQAPLETPAESETAAGQQQSAGDGQGPATDDAGSAPRQAGEG